MTKLILIRHGPTSWTEQKKYQGHTDTELSEMGIKKVRELAREFRKIKIDALYVSSLKRARQSAKILAKEGKLRPHPDRRICEMNFGKWEGQTAEDLFRAKDKVFLAWTQKQKWAAPPGGESLAAFRSRVGAFFKDCLGRHPGETVAVVSHGGAIRLMILEALKLPFKFFFSFHVDPASFSIVSADPQKSGRLLLLNARQFPRSFF